jgi:hypothetical protein
MWTGSHSYILRASDLFSNVKCIIFCTLDLIQQVGRLTVSKGRDTNTFPKTVVFIKKNVLMTEFLVSSHYRHVSLMFMNNLWIFQTTYLIVVLFGFFI